MLLKNHNRGKNSSKLAAGWQLFLDDGGRAARDSCPLDCESLPLFGPDTDWSRVSAAERDQFWSGLPETYAFKTSGSTGSPQSWLRRKTQIAAELAIIRELLRQRSVGCVLNFAPVRHLYGFLFGFGLPMQLDVPVVSGSPGEAAALIDRLDQDPLIVAVPSAMEALRRCSKALRQLGSITVVHSSARLPDGVVELPGLVPEGCLLEILGSTEAGLTGYRWRCGIETPPWQFAPDLEVVAPAGVGEEGELVLVSPRLARPLDMRAGISWHSGDLVRLIDGDHFEHLGRVSDLVKINGRRIHLEALEGRLRPVLVGIEFLLVMCEDAIRGETFELIYREDEASVTKGEAIWRAIAEVLPADLRPKRIRPVSSISRSVLGKPLSQQKGG